MSAPVGSGIWRQQAEAARQLAQAVAGKRERKEALAQWRTDWGQQMGSEVQQALGQLGVPADSNCRESQ